MHVSIYSPAWGFGPAQIDELTLGQASMALWTATERRVVQVVDELHQHSTVSDATWAA